MITRENRSKRPTSQQEIRLTDEQKEKLIKHCEAYSAANLAIIKLNGKTPLGNNWQKAKPLKPEAARTIAEQWLQTRDYPNFGVALPPHILVIDVDPRNFKNGVDSLEKLSTEIGVNLVTECNFKVKTGGGGFHLYFTLPAASHGKIAYKIKGIDGIEFKSFGGQVVLPGCIHPETDQLYETTIDSLGVQAIGLAPETLCQKITSAASGDHVGLCIGNTSGGFTNTEADQQKCRDHLSRLEPSIQGQGGDHQIYRAACVGKDYGLSPDVFFPLLAEYNKRSLPEWSEFELKLKIENAYGYAKNKAGALSVSNDFESVAESHEVEKDQPTWMGTLERTKAGEVRPNFKNAVIILENMDVFRKSLAINTFNNKIVFRKTLTWHPEYSAGMKEFGANGKPVDDDEMLLIKRHLVFNQDIDFQKAVLQEAARSAALANQFHPVREYLQAIKWDGKARIDSWLIDYMGVEDNIYTRAVGKKFMLAAVTRIFEPGHKFDTMMVLEGKIQGERKSTTLNALSQGWFIDNISDFQNKDTLLSCHNGVWIAECSELDFMSRTEITAQKAFNSRQIDSFRAPYDRFVKEYPRQFVMVGTTNQFQYLRDETGNRRYWPIRTNKIDQPRIKVEADQLWAEAYNLYQKKTDLVYMDEPALIEWERREQEARLQVDSWEETIADWFAEVPESAKEKIIWESNVFTFSDLWQYALGRNPGNFPKQEQNRIGAIMRKLGFEYKQFRNKEGQRGRGFVKCAY